MQDGATCHTIAESLEFLNEKFGGCFISNKTDSQFIFSKHFVKANFHKRINVLYNLIVQNYLKYGSLFLSVSKE